MTTIQLEKNADGSVTETVKMTDPELAQSLRVQAFEALFPECYDPQKVRPVPNMNVFILDSEAARQTKLVHVAQWCEETNSFDSDGGWFEPVEVLRWAYVPSIENERLRTIVP